MSLYDSNKKHIISNDCMPDTDHLNQRDRVYHGNRPVAYIDDLKDLHRQVVRWLTGHVNQFGYYGYLPLAEDGKMDPSYIRQQFVGVDVFNNAQLIDKNAKTLQFRGNLVKVLKDEDGKIIVYIKDRSESHLGLTDGKTDGNLYLDEVSQNRLTTMISPIGPDSRYFGYTPGEQIYGFVAQDKETDVLVWETVDKITFKDNHNTKFVISLLNATGQSIFTVQSQKVKGNEVNVIMGDNRYCSLEVFEFEKSEYEYAGKIRLKINLAGYIKKSSKFNVVITHYNSNFEDEITTWTSPDYFYCTGQQIDADKLEITAVVDYQADVVKQKVAGITYVNSGKIKFFISGIDNINNGAILPVKLKFESNITDEIYSFQDNDIDYNDDLPMTVDANNVTWSHSFEIKKDVLYPLNAVTAKVTLANAYCTVIKEWSSVKIKNQMEQAYINTCSNQYTTSNNIQAFDGFIFKSIQSDYKMPLFANKNMLLASEYLQVIPDYGLVWPDLFGVTNVNYNKRYFKRIFKGSDTNTDLSWGGTFVFGNLTKEAFFATNLSVKISTTFGETWYNLKQYKDGRDPEGILCSVQENNNQLIVNFAMPNSVSFENNELIYFELCMTHPNVSRITYIKLMDEYNSSLF